jgi:hypothetical protein
MPGASPDARASTVQSIAEEIHQAKVQSRVIEDALRSFNPDARVIDGRTAGITQALEARIAEVDRAIETAELAQQQARGELVRDLWRERVGLLDALVGVHVSRASEF